MPVTLADVLNAQATVETKVPVGDESLLITWRPGGLTGETDDQIDSIGRIPDDASAEDRTRAERLQARVLRRILGDLIADWDLNDGKGHKLPITATLAKLPGPFLWAVFNTLSNESGPKGTSEPPSSGT